MVETMALTMVAIMIYGAVVAGLPLEALMAQVEQVLTLNVSVVFTVEQEKELYKELRMQRSTSLEQCISLGMAHHVFLKRWQGWNDFVAARNISWVSERGWKYVGEETHEVQQTCACSFDVISWDLTRYLGGAQMVSSACNGLFSQWQRLDRCKPVIFSEDAAFVSSTALICQDRESWQHVEMSGNPFTRKSWVAFAFLITAVHVQEGKGNSNMSPSWDLARSLLLMSS